MTDKGKAALSPSELAEQERKTRIRERVAQWIRESDLGPPFFPSKHPEPHHSGPWQAGPSHLNQLGPNLPEPSTEPRRTLYGHTQDGPFYPDLRDPDSPEYTPASPHQSPIIIPDSPDSPFYTPASPMPEPYVITDLVPEETLIEFWERTARPIPPNLGPWYRFADGFIQFRYGTSWALIDRLEREAAWERRYARLRGEEAGDIPPPHRPGEILFHIREEPDSPPIARHVPLGPDPQDEEEEEPMEPVEPVVDEPMEQANSDDSSHGENDDEEDERAWSDTSTITVEPSMIPRRPIWARRVGARRT